MKISRNVSPGGGVSAAKLVVDGRTVDDNTLEAA